jgi:endonuclease VIII
MVDLMKRLMEANRTTGSQITTGDTRRGRTHWVAARTGRPCRRCGAPIRKADQPSHDGDRVTYWCPACQPGSGVGSATRV